jgi:hypothetical protein
MEDFNTYLWWLQLLRMAALALFGVERLLRGKEDSPVLRLMGGAMLLLINAVWVSNLLVNGVYHLFLWSPADGSAEVPIPTCPGAWGEGDDPIPIGELTLPVPSIRMITDRLPPVKLSLWIWRVICDECRTLRNKFRCWLVIQAWRVGHRLMVPSCFIGREDEMWQYTDRISLVKRKDPAKEEEERLAREKEMEEVRAWQQRHAGYVKVTTPLSELLPELTSFPSGMYRPPSRPLLDFSLPNRATKSLA